MRALKLDISPLPPTEIKLIKAYFRLYAFEADFLWEVAEVAPFDATIIDGENPEFFNAQAACGQLITLGGDALSDYSLPRPLQSDTLVALLRSLQPAVLSPDVYELGEEIVIDVANDQTEGEGGQAAIDASVAEHFKLMALPPVALLQRNPQRQQAADMMLRQPVTLQEISSATQWPLSEVQVFVGLLRNTGLLEVIAATPVATGEEVEFAATSDSDFPLSLGNALSSFRKKLGL